MRPPHRGGGHDNARGGFNMQGLGRAGGKGGGRGNGADFGITRSKNASKGGQSDSLMGDVPLIPPVSYLSALRGVAYPMPVGPAGLLEDPPDLGARWDATALARTAALIGGQPSRL